MQILNDFAYGEATNKRAPALHDPQAIVDLHFESAARDWERIYHESTLYGRIYQDRMEITLKWIDQLQLPENATLLEIGCGAGLATAALAKRGYRVDALDNVPAMINLTIKRLAAAGNAERVRVLHGDVRRLSMPNNSYNLVFALGVLPWLDDPAEAMHEMVRVTRTGGYVLVTADNNVHLEEVFDPVRFPLFKPVRNCLASALRAAKLLAPAPNLPKIHRYSKSEIGSLLAEAGLENLWSVMVGFGPFTLCGKRVFSDSVGIKVHRLLQAAAIRQFPVVSQYGMQYVVMAKKRAME
jgi:ubiquinone/menaquinone biosynthesis C-methylase UbiE